MRLARSLGGKFLEEKGGHSVNIERSVRQFLFGYWPFKHFKKSDDENVACCWTAANHLDEGSKKRFR